MVIAKQQGGIGRVEGILVHVFCIGSAGIKKKIVNEDDLNGLDLPAGLRDALRHFWLVSHENLFVSPQLINNGAAQRDTLVVIAERLVEQQALLVFGAGHVGYNIALIGGILGLKVLLLDDREIFLEQARVLHPNIEVTTIDFDDVGKNVQIPRNAAVVIVTRGHQSDEVILRQVANFDARYVGMIGSRRRVQGVFRRLREQGVSDSFLSEVKAPIGLDIGAKTPQEIAVAVHAEIIKHFNRAETYVSSGAR